MAPHSAPITAVLLQHRTECPFAGWASVSAQEACLWVKIRSIFPHPPAMAPSSRPPPLFLQPERGPLRA